MATEQIQFITQQIRAKHLGKKVFTHPEYGKEGPVKLVRAHLDVYVNGFGFEYYLQLRSIEALTDHEAIQIAKMYGWKENNPDFKERVLQFKIDLPCIAIPEYRHKHLHWVFDYLTQIGIALPHLIILPNGEIFTASVEWQIEKGIVKLTK